MNNTRSVVMLGLALAGLLLSQPMEMPAEDKTLSPYFMVKSDDPTTDRLPLLSTSAAVEVVGVIADVVVTQVYKNDGKRPIEAIYTFPGSTRAAVYAMKMTIGKRTIVAKINEREKARQDYEAARQQGKTASLLEQQRPNVFQMNVANIMPGDTIRVEMSYTELLVPTDGVYEFAYPTVVGPRYSNVPEKSAPESENWVKSPYLHEGEAPTYDFGIAVGIAAGLPIQEISCPSHKTNIKYDGLNSATVALDASEKQGGNRDFILRYRLAGGKIESGLLLYEGEDENFFLAMIQPPRRIDKELIPPREYVFIVDVSGSMHGFPLDISKTALRNLIANLRTTDYFNVLLFSGDNAVLSEHSLAATRANVEKATAFIDAQSGGGGTELLPALKRALGLPRAEGTSRTVVIVTDGYVTVETEAFDLIRESLGKANMFAFGIGSGVNRFIIEGMARVGMGEPFVIEKPEAAAAAAEKFRKYIQTPVLTNVKVSYSGFDAYDVEPLSVPDVLAERPIIVFGKWRGGNKGSITVTGSSGRGRYRQVLSVAGAKSGKANAALRYLWARFRIQMLADYNNLREDPKRVQEVTALGLKYNLLTQYTSFVAIDQEIRNVDGKPVVVNQALPLPQGVSDYAVGGGAAPGIGGSGRGYGMGKMSAPLAMRSVTSAQAQTGLVAEEKDELSVSPPPLPVGTVQIAGLTVDAVLAKRAVKETIEKRLHELLPAYHAELLADPACAGTIAIEFTIGIDGRATGFKVVKNALPRSMEQAVTAMLKKIQFGRRPAQLAVSLALSFAP
jgi:Ca-activated chloride channel family protein